MIFYQLVKFKCSVYLVILNLKCLFTKIQTPSHPTTDTIVKAMRKKVDPVHPVHGVCGRAQSSQDDRE